MIVIVNQQSATTDLRPHTQGDIIPRANMMNVSDPGGEPTIVLMSTPKRRNAVSLDAKAEHEAARDAANISIMSSSTPALGSSGRSEKRSGGQNGSQRRMTLKELQGKKSVASQAQSVAEEERMDKSALVPACACSTMLG